MSYFVAPFEVVSRIQAQPLPVRFVHLASGIATRHSDTIDCFFLVGGQKLIVALPCATLTELREREQKHLTDQQLAEIAATFLRDVLERGYDPTAPELRMSGDELRATARQLGFL